MSADNMIGNCNGCSLAIYVTYKDLNGNKTGEAYFAGCKPSVRQAIAHGDDMYITMSDYGCMKPENFRKGVPKEEVWIPATNMLQFFSSVVEDI